MAIAIGIKLFHYMRVMMRSLGASMRSVLVRTMFSVALGIAVGPMGLHRPPCGTACLGRRHDHNDCTRTCSSYSIFFPQLGCSGRACSAR